MSAPLLLVRHGQSEWNRARRTQGQVDHPALTPLGRAQAAAAAEAVAGCLGQAAVDPRRRGPEVGLWTSDLVRARQTAEVIAGRLDAGRLDAGRLDAVVTVDVRLREQHLGALEGLPYEESWAAAAAHDWSDPRLPVAGGESLAGLRERMGAALTDALAVAGSGRPVILVTHGDALRTALAWVAGEHVGETPWVEVPNGAVFVVRPAWSSLSWDRLPVPVPDLAGGDE